MKHIDYQRLSKSFRMKEDWTDSEPLRLSDTEAVVHNLEYVSRHAHHLLGAPSYRCEAHNLDFPGEPVEGGNSDCQIAANISFRYPLVREPGTARHRRVTMILHGLNERSFTRYLPWAYHLWDRTGDPVILFPLAFHINRVLPGWARHQQEIGDRRCGIPSNEYAHRFNAIISDRLELHPARFFWGAVQSYHDVLDLVRTIRRGEHPHFEPGAQIDLVGYSAGGYLALIFLMENPEGLFADSRCVAFATAVPTRDLCLSSPLILDMTAEVALMKLYVRNIDRLANARMRHWFDHHGEGRWIRAFSGTQPHQALIETRMRELAPRLLGISNVNDLVTPTGAMLNTLQGLRRDTGVPVIELNLGIHENPFVCPDYEQPQRRFIMECLDEARYGTEFERFIGAVVSHVQSPGASVTPAMSSAPSRM